MSVEVIAVRPERRGGTIIGLIVVFVLFALRVPTGRSVGEPAGLFWAKVAFYGAVELLLFVMLLWFIFGRVFVVVHDDGFIVRRMLFGFRFGRPREFTAQAMSGLRTEEIEYMRRGVRSVRTVIVADANRKRVELVRFDAKADADALMSGPLKRFVPVP